MSDYDPTKPLWSIMTKSRAGNVSVIRGLTLEEARRAYERLDPCYGMRSAHKRVHRAFKTRPCSVSFGSGLYQIQDSDIDVREVFGPAGWTGFGPDEITNWPVFDFVYTDEDGNILPDEYQDSPELAASFKSGGSIPMGEGGARIFTINKP